jgi:hypothetical protein
MIKITKMPNIKKRLIKSDKKTEDITYKMSEEDQSCQEVDRKS